MLRFKLIKDKSGMIEYIETDLSGADLLSNSKLNKGCAYTLEERTEFHLTGLLPHVVETLEQQVTRMYLQYGENHSNLRKNIYLNVLHDYNETLFYTLVSQHLEEMLPIIYTPTVGEAVQRYSLEHRKANGLYISYEDRNNIEQILDYSVAGNIDLSVITDGGAVLGIGDQGIGGINISIAKLMVYTLCAGIHPRRYLPIQLDVGTNNPLLLNDPMYLGARHERVTGQAYDDFIDQFVQAMNKKFPSIMLHWEDVGRDNARRILDRYRNQVCTFNDDIQGTGVVALACVLAGVKASGIPLSEHRIVIFGAGTAGVGIADQIKDALVHHGLSEDQARERLWLIDKTGLLTTASELLPFQKNYARPQTELNDWHITDPNNINLADVVNHVHPTILIGCSTVTGAFNESVVKAMSTYVDRPIIMPLSNPTPLSEATPEDLLKWTEGRAVIATGSPFPPVFFQNKKIDIAQSNNALAFPGIGLGVIAVKAERVSEEMLWAATTALSACSPIENDKLAPLLPKLANAKMVCYKVGIAVAEQAVKEGLAKVQGDIHDLVHRLMWTPKYYPYRRHR